MRVWVEGPFKEAGHEGVILTQKDKRGKMRMFLTFDPTAVYNLKTGVSKAFTPEVFAKHRPPMPIFFTPLTPGRTVNWNGALKVAWVDKPVVLKAQVVGFETIRVPAGTFECVKLHFDERRGNEKIEEYAWYAKGVGQVRYEGGQYLKELKSFRAASAKAPPTPRP